MFTANICDKENLQSGNLCIVQENTFNTYWWATIKSVKESGIHYPYLILELDINKGPFKIQNENPVISNEISQPIILNGTVYPSNKTVWELIDSNIKMKNYLLQEELESCRYKNLYNNIISQVLTLINNSGNKL
mgnify:CR=1 FL=1